MSDGVRVVVKIAAKQEAIADIKAIVLVLAEKSRQETGCIAYDVLQDLADPTAFVLIEEWASVPALDAHNKTPHFHEAVTSSAPFLAKPLEVGRFSAIG